MTNGPPNNTHSTSYINFFLLLNWQLQCVAIRLFASDDETEFN